MDNQTIHCPNCGTVNPITAKFCGNCGQDLTEAIARVTDPNKAAYQAAMADLVGGNLEAAVQGFRALGGYADAPDQLEKAMARLNAQQEAHRASTYEAATAAFGQGDLGQAASLFQQLGDYKDATQKLALVHKAQAAEMQRAQQQSAQQAAEEYERAYNTAIQNAEAAQTTANLQQYIDYLSKFAGYRDVDQQLAKFKQKYATLAVAEQQQKSANAKTGKLVAIIAAIVIVLGGGGWFAYSQHQNAQADLAKQVTAQRQTNAKSFNHLDSQTRSNIKTMFATYHANPNDYTYKLKASTDDYQVVTYTFRGPDKTKDILPASGTRIYGEVALYRQ
ncbi:zinc ribbon domain-containing protein [Lacticaseibacillus sp. GG6-2]